MASDSKYLCAEWGQLGQAPLKGEIPELQVNKSPIDPQFPNCTSKVLPSGSFVERLLLRTDANLTWIVRTQYCKGLLAFLMVTTGVKIDVP